MMEKNIVFRNFQGCFGVSEDYIKLHNFLVEIGNTEFTYARLDWMITHRPYLQEEHLHKIGIWEENNQIVATTLFDTELEEIFPMAMKGYEYLYPEMLEYAKKNMTKGGQAELKLFINDRDEELIHCVHQLGFVATEEKDMAARFDMQDDILDRKLPEGYTFVSMDQERDYEKYARCLFRGFDHEEAGEVFSFDEKMLEEHKKEYERELVDLSLKISVKAPDGSYVAHCGMWYDKKSEFAIIEPVATDPKYRRMGLAKAAVLEGLARVKEMGAKYAMVGSNQQFYYSIGLIPYSTGTFWVKGMIHESVIR